MYLYTDLSVVQQCLQVCSQLCSDLLQLLVLSFHTAGEERKKMKLRLRELMHNIMKVTCATVPHIHVYAAASSLSCSLTRVLSPELSPCPCECELPPASPLATAADTTEAGSPGTAETARLPAVHVRREGQEGREG